MRFTFNIDVEVARVQGKFAPRDEIANVIIEWLEAANEGSIEAGDDGFYEVTEYEVIEVDQPKPMRTRRDAAVLS